MDAIKLISHRGLDIPNLNRRRVDVWLPDEYHTQPERHFPVLYMQDGQNIYKPKLSTGPGWRVVENVRALVAAGKIDPPIVVGITSTMNRMGDYMPQKAMQNEAALAYMDAQFRRMPYRMTRGMRGDLYLTWIVEKLKPLIDSTYRSLREAEHTAILGSSMGALISLYALCEYPQVFGCAGCMSTHWPIGGDYLIDWFGEHLPPPGIHKLYFDHGDQGLDEPYAEWQAKMDATVLAAGYTDGRDFLSFNFPGEGHAEQYWAGRLQIPLEFFFGIGEGE